MKPPKSFDCVEMKNVIQAQLLQERAGMTDEEEGARIEHELRTGKDPLALLWRELVAREKPKGAAFKRRGLVHTSR